MEDDIATVSSNKKEKIFVVPSDAQEILFAKESDINAVYGFQKRHLEIAQKTLEELRESKKVAYVSKTIAVAIHSIAWESFLNPEDLPMFICEGSRGCIPLWKVVDDFRKWGEEKCPWIKKITLVVNPLFQDEYATELKKAFLPEGNVQISFAKFQEKENGFWLVDDPPGKRAELEKRWKTRERWRSRLPKKLFEWIFP